MLDPHFAAHFEAQRREMEGRPAPAVGTVPPPMVRAAYRAGRMATDRNPPQDLDVRDLKVGEDGAIPARLYVPHGASATGPGVVYFHGGGFVIGDLDSHDGHCRRMAAYAGVRVMAVDYRLAPEQPFPAGHDDALAATRWAFDHAAEIGFDPASIAVAGDSAGGNLAAVAAQDLRGDPARRLKFQMLLYPATYPHAQTESWRTQEGPVLTKAAMAWFEQSLAAHGHAQGARAFPARADLAGLPPALVVTAGFDMLRDEGRDYAAALRSAGVEARHLDYASLPHDFFIIPDVSPAVIEAARETAAALKAGLEG
jgi:acetyl esterase